MKTFLLAAYASVTNGCYNTEHCNMCSESANLGFLVFGENEIK